MDRDNEAFLSAIRTNPFDHAPRLIYADWLDEQDEPVKAEYVRLVVQLRDHVLDEQALKRMIEVASSLPQEWRVAVGGCFELHFDTGDSKQMMQAVFDALTFFAPKKPTATDERAIPESFRVVSQITREMAESMLQQYGFAGLTRFRLFVKASQPEFPTAPPSIPTE